METKDVIIYVLCLMCLLLCYLGVQQNTIFILPKTGKYCYAKTQAPKNIVALAEFDTLKDCEEFVKNSLFYSRGNE